MREFIILVSYIIGMMAYLIAHTLNAPPIVIWPITILALSLSIWLGVYSWIAIQNEFDENQDHR